MGAFYAKTLEKIESWNDTIKAPLNLTQSRTRPCPHPLWFCFTFFLLMWSLTSAGAQNVREGLRFELRKRWDPFRGPLPERAKANTHSLMNSIKSTGTQRVGAPESRTGVGADAAQIMGCPWLLSAWLRLMAGKISAGKLCKKKTLENNKSVSNKGRGSFCPSDVCKRLKMNSQFSCL